MREETEQERQARTRSMGKTLVAVAAILVVTGVLVATDFLGFRFANQEGSSHVTQDSKSPGKVSNAPQSQDEKIPPPSASVDANAWPASTMSYSEIKKKVAEQFLEDMKSQSFEQITKRQAGRVLYTVRDGEQYFEDYMICKPSDNLAPSEAADIIFAASHLTVRIKKDHPGEVYFVPGGNVLLNPQKMGRHLLPLPVTPSMPPEPSKPIRSYAHPNAR